MYCNKCKFLLFFIFIIISCSKDNYTSSSSNNSSNSNDYSQSGSDSSSLELLWENGTSYTSNIKVGQTITWIWGSGRHNLKTTGGSESFDSGYSSYKGFKFSFTFDNVGTTNYVCTPHSSHMYGKVIVTE